MAGSKQRFNVQGNVVMGLPDEIKHLRRLASGELHQIFMQAKEQGQARITLHEEQFILLRHPDHTFTLESGSLGHIVM